MRLSEILLGARPFASGDDILSAVRSCLYFEPKEEDISEADLLLIFQTSSQQSWLVFTSERIYFVLDDIRNSAPQVRWRRVKEKLVDRGRVIIDIKLEDKSDSTGRINIGRMNKGFLYSKHLFVNSNIKGDIYKLIKHHMLQTDHN